MGTCFVYHLYSFAVSTSITFHMYVGSQRFKSFQTCALYTLCCDYMTVTTLHHLPYSFVHLNLTSLQITPYTNLS